MRKVKSFIPSFIKHPLWFIFKAPQRKSGWFSLWLDAGGYVKYFFYSFFETSKPQSISICVGIYNRSDQFLNYFLPSLLKCNDMELIELSVYDTGSTDIDNFKMEIIKNFKGRLVFTSELVEFTRAHSFNKAVEQSTSNKIFICDADFSLPQNLVRLCNRYTHGKTVWFPIVFYLFKHKPVFFDPKNGEWMFWGGKGILACNKRDFIQVGKLNEKFTKWGFEDEELWLRFYQHRFFIIRNRCKGLLHHWHPSLNPKYKRLEELADRGLL
ncbi:MAG: hypothetical protein H7296_05655 [Bacteroidia bacterium]|nr:hypothetical protein [Bacteroidia bacterium]